MFHLIIGKGDVYFHINSRKKTTKLSPERMVVFVVRQVISTFLMTSSCAGFPDRSTANSDVCL